VHDGMYEELQTNLLPCSTKYKSTTLTLDYYPHKQGQPLFLARLSVN